MQPISSFTLIAKTYTEALLKDKNTPNDHSYSLYRVLILTTKTYTEALLKDRSTPDGLSQSISGPHPDD